MDVSELRLAEMRWSGSEDERNIVVRLFEDSNAYRSWESYHAGLMRKVCRDGAPKGQVLAMRKARFELIHRQSLFEYLRESSTTGEDRYALFRGLHRSQDYARAVLAEHSRYLQSNSSLYCADHLGHSIMGDRGFARGLRLYRRRYLTYFGHYCDWIISEYRGESTPSRWLLPPLKQEILSLQQSCLALPAPGLPARH